MGFSLGNLLPSLPFIPAPPTISNPIPKPPKPAQVLLPPAPPKILGGGANKLYNVVTAPIKSTIAADPLLSWAQNGKWSSHGARTRAGVHELYKEDRLAQRLGVREKDVVTVVEVAQVVVAIYFGASMLGGSSAGVTAGTSATSGTVGTAAGTAAGGITLAGVNSAIGAVGTVAKLVGGSKSSPSAQVGAQVGPDGVAPGSQPQNKNDMTLPVVLGGLASLALLVF